MKRFGHVTVAALALALVGCGGSSGTKDAGGSDAASGSADSKVDTSGPDAADAATIEVADAAPVDAVDAAVVDASDAATLDASDSSSDLSDGGGADTPRADGSADSAVMDGASADASSTDALTDAGKAACLAAPVVCGAAPADLGHHATLVAAQLASPASGATSGVPDGGFPPSTHCDSARLRLRVSSVEVVHQGKNVWLPTGTLDGPAQSYYCLVQTKESGAAGATDVALTKHTPAVPDHAGVDFGPDDSDFWSANGSPRTTLAGLSVVYACFQQKVVGDDASWSAVFQALKTSAGAAPTAGPRAWTFTDPAAALAAVTAVVNAASQNGDWHIADASQTIDASWLLPLTNYAVWSFTQAGGEAAFGYPWSLTVNSQAWGCAGSN